MQFSIDTLISLIHFLLLMLKNRRLWRRRPAFIIPDDSNPRRVSRLELFFDLIFVVIFRQLFAIISHDFSSSAIWEYTLYFIPLWMVRHAVTFYTQRFEDNTIRHRRYMFVIIGILMFAAVSVHSELVQQFQLFVGSFIAIKLMLTYLITTASLHGCERTAYPKIDKRLLFVLSGMHAGIGILRSMLYFFPEWFALIVFWSLIIEITTFVTLANHKNNDLPSFDRNHLIERYGLIILVALAEVMYSVVEWLSLISEFTPTLLIIELGLLAIAFGLRWLYFDQITYRPLMRSKTKSLIRSYLHLPLTYLIVLLGGVILYIVTTAYTQSIVFEIRTLFTITFSWILLIIGLLNLFHEPIWSEGPDVTFPKHINHLLLASKIVGVVACFGILLISRQLEIRVFLALNVWLLALLDLEWIWYWVRWQAIHIEEECD